MGVVIMLISVCCGVMDEGITVPELQAKFSGLFQANFGLLKKLQFEESTSTKTVSVSEFVVEWYMY